jgi:hypothetical protein
MDEKATSEAEARPAREIEALSELSYADAPPVGSQDAWDELNDWLPEMLGALRASEAFNEDNPPQPSGRGIYLFSQGTEHLYVGRTGITARSRAIGKEPSTNFFNRWDPHTNPNSPPNSAPFANKLACELAQAFNLEMPAQLKERFGLARTADWWRLRIAQEPPDYYLAFEEAKRFIRKQLDYRIVAFNEDVRGVRSHVAEVYVDVVLQTTYGDFSTS